ncbi:OsmC family protein [Acidithiobacillus sp. AMEEHan]|uniref:OsmC family protein n=1 Tax=Acidithiobacillus sp. AMEEHan TaxID=2994951 RepID=UPI0027E5239B|nr:OsmC family protein [Acidithiobacillus sp. AMEEHan]
MQATVEWTGSGGMAFVAHADSGHGVVMDASPDIGGHNLGARPMEMVLMGLGGCSSIDVLMILQKSRQDVRACRVEISAERAEQDPKVFTVIHLQFFVTGKELDPRRVAHAIQLSADKYCSVSIMLGKTAKITHDYTILGID